MKPVCCKSVDPRPIPTLRYLRAYHSEFGAGCLAYFNATPPKTIRNLSESPLQKCSGRHVTTISLGVAPLLYAHLNLEHTGPLVAVRIPEDRAVERLGAAK